MDGERGKKNGEKGVRIFNYSTCQNCTQDPTLHNNIKRSTATIVPILQVVKAEVQKVKRSPRTQAIYVRAKMPTQF